MTRLKLFRLLAAVLFVVSLFSSCESGEDVSFSSSIETISLVSEALDSDIDSVYESISESFYESSREADNITTINGIPKFDGKNAYIAINNNIPEFTEPMLSLSSVGIIPRPMQDIATPHLPNLSRGE